MAPPPCSHNPLSLAKTFASQLDCMSRSCNLLAVEGLERAASRGFYHHLLINLNHTYTIIHVCMRGLQYCHNFFEMVGYVRDACERRGTDEHITMSHLSY